MSHEAVLEKLARYEVLDSADRLACARMILFISGESRCFEHTLEQGHVTGSAWLVDATGDRILLTHHRKLNKWLQLGGHADGDSDIARVARREAEEESGLGGIVLLSDEIFDLDIHLIPARGEAPEHLHYDIRFAFTATTDEEFQISEESHDLRWVPIEELEEFTVEPSMLRMKAKWESRKAFYRANLSAAAAQREVPAFAAARSESE